MSITTLMLKPSDLLLASKAGNPNLMDFVLRFTSLIWLYMAFHHPTPPLAVVLRHALASSFFNLKQRKVASLFPDSFGASQYACMTKIAKQLCVLPI